MAATAQEKTIGAALADLGLTGFSGVGAAVDGTTNTTLDITVTPPAWAVLADGTVLAGSSELATTSITGLSTNGSLHLYLDYSGSGGSYSPAWGVAASAPSGNAIKVADVTVSSNHITAVTMVGAGLQGLTLSAATTTTAPADGAGDALPAHAGVYVTLTIDGVARKIAAW